MREEYPKYGNGFRHGKKTKNIKSPQGSSVTAEFNAMDAASGTEDRAIFVRIEQATGFAGSAYATLTPDQAEELGGHLIKLADDFREARKPLTRVQVIDALPVGTVFKTSLLATYVRTEAGVTILAGFDEGGKREIDPFFRRANGGSPSDIKVIFNPEVTK